MSLKGDITDLRVRTNVRRNVVNKHVRKTERSNYGYNPTSRRKKKAKAASKSGITSGDAG